jgi:hypothetical protein
MLHTRVEMQQVVQQYEAVLQWRVITILARGIKKVKQKITSTYYGAGRMLDLRYILLIRTN